MSSLEVRGAAPGDAQALRVLTLAFTPELASQVSVAEFMKRLRRRAESPDWHIAVASAGGQMIGYVAA